MWGWGPQSSGQQSQAVLRAGCCLRGVQGPRGLGILSWGTPGQGMTGEGRRWLYWAGRGAGAVVCWGAWGVGGGEACGRLRTGPGPPGEAARVEGLRGLGSGPQAGPRGPGGDQRVVTGKPCLDSGGGAGRAAQEGLGEGCPPTHPLGNSLQPPTHRRL